MRAACSARRAPPRHIMPEPLPPWPPSRSPDERGAAGALTYQTASGPFQHGLFHSGITTIRLAIVATVSSLAVPHLRRLALTPPATESPVADAPRCTSGGTRRRSGSAARSVHLGR